MRKTRKKLIVIPSGAITKIAERLHCSRNTVTNALRYKDNGAELAILIRETAVKEFGGKQTSILV